MKHESKKHYRKLRRFIHKLGIKSADTVNNDLALDLMEALEAAMYEGGKPDSLFMDPITFAGLSGLFKK